MLAKAQGSEVPAEASPAAGRPAKTNRAAQGRPSGTSRHDPSATLRGSDRRRATLEAEAGPNGRGRSAAGPRTGRSRASRTASEDRAARERDQPAWPAVL